MLLDSFDLPRPPRPPAALPWTEERLRHVRRRWKQGARAREIGAELGVSANAVIAKIHRLGIARLSPYGGAPGRRQKAAKHSACGAAAIRAPARRLLAPGATGPSA